MFSQLYVPQISVPIALYSQSKTRGTRVRVRFSGNIIYSCANIGTPPPSPPPCYFGRTVYPLYSSASTKAFQTDLSPIDYHAAAETRIKTIRPRHQAESFIMSVVKRRSNNKCNVGIVCYRKKERKQQRNKDKNQKRRK